VRAELEKELQKQRSGRKFAEAAETFSNLVYEQPDSLKPAADHFKLQVQDAGWVTRSQVKVKTLNHPGCFRRCSPRRPSSNGATPRR
jgi:peptidyl-prolyl cis-trans isomerase D